jgi:hypothetical protein
MTMNIGEMATYEFYRRVETGRDHFIGTLLERRRNPARITKESILNWARGFFMGMNDEEFYREIYFLKKMI